MQFTKEIRNKNLTFYVEKNDDTAITVRVVLPPYGSYSRGELYTSEELNTLIKEEFTSAIPLNKDGRFLASKESNMDVYLNFKKPIIKSKKIVSSSDENKVIRKSSIKKTTKTKK